MAGFYILFIFISTVFLQMQFGYIGCNFQSNAAVIRISHISAQSSLTPELYGCWLCSNAQMYGMQYTSHALKLID